MLRFVSAPFCTQGTALPCMAPSSSPPPTGTFVPPPREGLTEAQAVAAVKAATDAPPKGMRRAGVILAALRSLDSDHSLGTAKLAADSGAEGFDLAGNEELYPLRLHTEALQLCKYGEDGGGDLRSAQRRCNTHCMHTTMFQDCWSSYDVARW